MINGGMATIADSTITDNAGETNDSGGLANYGGQVRIVRSLVIGNGAIHDAGGLYTESGAMTITLSTIAHNSADGAGGLFIASGTLELQNIILARNTAASPYSQSPDCGGPIISLGNNLIGDPTGCTITLQPTERTGDPGLGAYTDDGTPGHGHFPLLSTMPATPPPVPGGISWAPGGIIRVISGPSSSRTARRWRRRIVGLYVDSTGNHGFLYDEGVFFSIDVPQAS